MSRKHIQLKQFRSRVYHALTHRADAILDLLDALCSNTTARSVVELNLSPVFRRRHASVHDAIDGLLSTKRTSRFDRPRRALESRLRRAIGPLLPSPSRRRFWLVALDSLPIARPQAHTLRDRSHVHRCDPVRSNTPVTVGHAYSLAMALPERSCDDPPWVVPLSGRRIPSRRTPADVAVEQVWDLRADAQAPWADELLVVVADSSYGTAPFLSEVAGEHKLATIARLRSNRVLYHAPPPSPPGRRGRPPTYGPRFALREPDTWGPPADVCLLARRSRAGRNYTVHIQRWRNLRLRGQRDYPVHRYPVEVLRVAALDDAGKRLHRRPLWLVVAGEDAASLSSEEIHDAYTQRFDQEHAHRFLRQRLLLDDFQTPVTEHEENWITLSLLAYTQLFAARDVAIALRRPWERAKSAQSDATASPTMVQRDFARITGEIGTPARAPKPRGNSPGRAVGHRPARRARQPVVYKGRQAA